MKVWDFFIGKICMFFYSVISNILLNFLFKFLFCRIMFSLEMIEMKTMNKLDMMYISIGGFA